MFSFQNKRWTVLLILSLLSLVILNYSRLFSGAFLHDDLRHLSENVEFSKVQTLQDVRAFSIQPSRPIPNFVSAFIQWAVGSRAGVHRAVSLLLHLSVSGLLFLNLLLFARRFSDAPQVPLAAALCTGLFALHPLCTDIVILATYRWELLGTLFTLAAMSLLHTDLNLKNGVGFLRLVLVCGLVAAAAFSKEPYGLFAPLSCVLTYCLRGTRPFLAPFLFALLATVGFSGAILLELMGKSTKFPYAGFIGSGVIQPEHHLQLAALALSDFVQKFFLVRPLSFIRLASRLKYDLQILPIQSVAVLIIGLLTTAYLVKKSQQSRPWIVIGAVVLAFYLCIPNIDMGAQHYYYLAVASLAASLMPVWAKLLALPTRNARVSLIVLGALIVGLQTILLFSRTGEFSSRQSLRVAELGTLGDLPVTWAWVAFDLAQDRSVSTGEVTTFLARAQQKFPGDIEIQMVTREIAQMRQVSSSLGS